MSKRRPITLNCTEIGHGDTSNREQINLVQDEPRQVARRLESLKANNNGTLPDGAEQRVKDEVHGMMKSDASWLLPPISRFYHAMNSSGEIQSSTAQKALNTDISRIDSQLEHYGLTVPADCPQ